MVNTRNMWLADAVARVSVTKTKSTRQQTKSGIQLSRSLRPSTCLPKDSGGCSDACPPSRSRRLSVKPRIRLSQRELRQGNNSTCDPLYGFFSVIFDFSA